MIKQLFDPANAVTALGLVLSLIGISLAISGQPELGIAVALWALLADHLDGVIAQRTQGRTLETREVGKNLDSLADLISAGIFPAITLITLSRNTIFSVLVSAIFVLASALRLSFFNVFGSPEGRFIGVPTTYAVPLTAVIFLLRPIIPNTAFPIVFSLVLILLALLHISTIRVPKTAGVMYSVVTLFALGSSFALTLRILG